MESHQSSSKDGGGKAKTTQPSIAAKNQTDSQPFFQPLLIQRKLEEAGSSSSEGLDKDTKPGLENYLDQNLDNVRVHNNPASHAASSLIQAKAYTLGNHIYLGSDVGSMSPIQRKTLLAHETVHTLQQQSGSPQLQTKLQVSQPGDAMEQQAESISHNFVQAQTVGYSSPALGMRNQQRILRSAAPSIQRDIKGSQNLTNGKMELDFTKKDAATAGAGASEQGWVKFHPKDTAPESNDIRLLQIVRTTDIAGATSGSPNTPLNWANDGTGAEADRNKMQTTDDSKKGILGGFFVDHSAATANPRTAKSDAAVSPYYSSYWSGATGKRKGKDKASATLWDGPGSTAAIGFNLVTSAKANDTGAWYGTALWGFEIYKDAKGIPKIKGEYHSFRDERGATTDAALDKFNEFYKNPGSSGAPSK